MGDVLEALLEQLGLAVAGNLDSVRLTRSQRPSGDDEPHADRRVVEGTPKALLGFP